MNKFEKYFKLPFTLDTWGAYVFDANGQLVLQFCNYEQDMAEATQIVDSINNKTSCNIKNLEYDTNGGYILSEGGRLISIRGFGYLTGTGGCNLPDKKATEIQDDLGNYILGKLKGDSTI